MNNECRMYHKKSDSTWPLCDPVSKGGTRGPASQHPHRYGQSNALKGHKSPSGNLGEVQLQGWSASHTDQSSSICNIL